MSVSISYEKDDVCVLQLDAELRALDLGSTTLLGISFLTGTCDVVLTNAPDPTDQAAIDSVIAAHTPLTELAKAKAAKYDRIDARTRALIERGFTFADKVFSLSLEAQAKIMGVNQVRDDPNVSYPIRWNTLDDEDYLDVADAAGMLAFYLTGVGTYRAHIDSGSALKAQVRAATTVEAVAAVTDER